MTSGRDDKQGRSGPETLIYDSWPKSGPFEPKKEEKKQRRFYEFTVEDFSKDGGCPEHPTAGSYLVKDYAYEYPGGEIRNMALGWVCAGCLRRGWCWDGNRRVTIYPSPKPRRRVYVP